MEKAKTSPPAGLGGDTHKKQVGLIAEPQKPGEVEEIEARSTSQS